jgi:hypothetical protein
MQKEGPRKAALKALKQALVYQPRRYPTPPPMIKDAVVRQLTEAVTSYIERTIANDRFADTASKVEALERIADHCRETAARLRNPR